MVTGLNCVLVHSKALISGSASISEIPLHKSCVDVGHVDPEFETQLYCHKCGNPGSLLGEQFNCTCV